MHEGDDCLPGRVNYVSHSFCWVPGGEAISLFFYGIVFVHVVGSYDILAGCGVFLRIVDSWSACSARAFELPDVHDSYQN